MAKPWPRKRVCTTEAGRQKLAERTVRRGDRVELTIGPRQLRAASPRPRHLLPVPPLVDRAAPSGVRPGEPGGAAVLGASSGFAEGAHHRSGAGVVASAIASQHNQLGLFPHPSRASSSRPRLPRRSGSLWSRRVGCRLPGLLWRSWSIRLGLGWLGVARRARPHRHQRVVGCRSGTRPASPERRVGRGVRGSSQGRAQRSRRSPPKSPLGRDRVVCPGGRQ
jgi:hypothetical protein